MEKSPTAVMTGFTMLLGSNPYLNVRKFKKVEIGIVRDNVSIIVKIGIKITNQKLRIRTL